MNGDFYGMDTDGVFRAAQSGSGDAARWLLGDKEKGAKYKYLQRQANGTRRQGLRDDQVEDVLNNTFEVILESKDFKNFDFRTIENLIIFCRSMLFKQVDILFDSEIKKQLINGGNVPNIDYKNLLKDLKDLLAKIDQPQSSETIEPVQTTGSKRTIEDARLILNETIQRIVAKLYQNKHIDTFGIFNSLEELQAIFKSNGINSKTQIYKILKKWREHVDARLPWLDGKNSHSQIMVFGEEDPNEFDPISGLVCNQPAIEETLDQKREVKTYMDAFMQLKAQDRELLKARYDELTLNSIAKKFKFRDHNEAVRELQKAKSACIDQLKSLGIEVIA